MGFLDELWDETLAGPAPGKGISRLRKYKSLSAVESPISGTRYHDDVDHQTVGVSRSITIIRPKNLSVEPPPPPPPHPGSAASSPSTPSGLASPFSPGETSKDPDGKRFSRRKPKPTTQHGEPTSPTVYDWIMISALDR